MNEYHTAMTRKPHHVGTEANYQYAVYMQDKLKSFGWDVVMNKYDVYIPWPGNNRVRLTAPEQADLTLVEPPLPEDPDSAVCRAQLPAFAAYCHLRRRRRGVGLRQLRTHSGLPASGPEGHLAEREDRDRSGTAASRTRCAG